MTQDIKENHPKTFAEKLKQHSKFCEDMMNRSQELISKVRAIKEESNKERRQLLQQAEETLALVDKAMKKFDAKYAKELDILSRI